MFKLRTRQGGAVIVTVAFALLLLLGFMGIALDFGHLFVVRTKLQTAMDACALAAAQEIDCQPDSLTRGSNAGITAGNLNAVNMQSTSWSGKTRVTTGDIAFLDQNYLTTTTVADARFVSCRHTQAGTATRLIHALSTRGGSPAYAGTMNVPASAIATLSPAQSACPMPLALHPKSGGVSPNYGFVKGEWVALLSKANAKNGQIGWANLDGSKSALETEAELNGHCGTRVNDVLGRDATARAANRNDRRDLGPDICDATNCEGVTVSVTNMQFKWVSPLPRSLPQKIINLPVFSTYLPREMMRYDDKIC